MKRFQPLSGYYLLYLCHLCKYSTCLVHAHWQRCFSTIIDLLLSIWNMILTYIIILWQRLCWKKAWITMIWRWRWATFAAGNFCMKMKWPKDRTFCSCIMPVTPKVSLMHASNPRQTMKRLFIRRKVKWWAVYAMIHGAKAQGRAATFLICYDNLIV